MKISLETLPNTAEHKNDILELSIFGKLEGDTPFGTESFQTFQELLKKCGVSVFVYEDIKEKYAWCKIRVSSNARGAGRKLDKREPRKYTQLDILTMLCHSSNKEIMETLEISESTYYRAKRRLLRSALYLAVQKDGNLKNYEKLSRNRNQYQTNDGNVVFSGKFLQ